MQCSYIQYHRLYKDARARWGSAASLVQGDKLVCCVVFTRRLTLPLTPMGMRRVTNYPTGLRTRPVRGRSSSQARQRPYSSIENSKINLKVEQQATLVYEVGGRVVPWVKGRFITAGSGSVTWCWLLFCNGDRQRKKHLHYLFQSVRQHRWWIFLVC